jgi:hypothetical protein
MVVHALKEHDPVTKIHFSVGLYNLHTNEQLINTYRFAFMRPGFGYTERRILRTARIGVQKIQDLRTPLSWRKNCVVCDECAPWDFSCFRAKLQRWYNIFRSCTDCIRSGGKHFSICCSTDEIFLDFLRVIIRANLFLASFTECFMSLYRKISFS